ncbi:poly(A)-specific ribonuclease PARN-like [Haliotis asinina]|uniref:poly(A)-specific ribonuclease PARN-like n=1 Tax=Haliotis asinina TaxID=109174 RepID=UPI003531BBCE
MEVTKANFKECLSQIEEAISEADFLAIDGEFTGLHAKDAESIGSFDTPEERYHKLRKGAAQFLLVQFGLAAFKYDPETKSYTARPFNMYVFPRPFSRQAPDRRFLCQASSIDFLVSQNFDFNKLFREGISYLTLPQEEHLKESIKKRNAEHTQLSSPAFTSPHGASAGPNKGPVEVPDDQKDFIDNICEQIKDYIAKATKEPLQLPQCSAFQRKLIYQTARLKYSNIHLETKIGEKKERYIVVSAVESEQDLRDKEKAKMDAEMAEVDEAIGFCKITRMLSQSGKLVVGHNMLLDLIHVINQFNFPLPEEYDEFKAMLKCCLPRLLDTKLMASTAPFKDLIINTTLGDLRRTVEAKPFVKPQVDLPEEFSKYSAETEFLHEAGYDAYITGIAFIGMANFLGTFQQPPEDWISPQSPLIEPFVNKLFMMRVYDIPYLNLTGPDVVPVREHVFHVTFPKEWKSHDIVSLFAPYGGVSLSWINETSAFAALFRKDNAPAAVKGLVNGEDNSVKVMTYEDFKKHGATSQYSLMPRKRKHTSDDAENSKKPRISPAAESTTGPEGDEVKEEDVVKEKMETNSGCESPDSCSDKKAKKMFEEPEVW